MWVRFLSPTRGLTSAFAFGGSRSRRRFVGCLDLFNEISVRVSASKRGSYLALQEGALIRGLGRLRSDWPRFGLAVNCARFLQSFGIGPEGAGEALFLMREVLRLLDEGEKLPRLLPLFFRIRLAFEQGYALDLSHCARCKNTLSGASERSFLLLSEGRIICSSCAGTGQDRLLPLGGEALRALEKVALLPPSEWNQVGLSGSGVQEFARAVDGFIEYHVGVAWDKGRFVRR